MFKKIFFFFGMLGWGFFGYRVISEGIVPWGFFGDGMIIIAILIVMFSLFQDASLRS